MTRRPSGRRWRSGGVRWVVPAGVVALVGLGAAVAGLAPEIAAATAASLPARTPRQLVAALRASGGQPLSGTIRQSSELGLPDLPAVAVATAPAGGVEDELLPASRTARVWVGSPTQERLALIGDLSESDVVRNGRDLWLWDSSADTASHLRVPGTGPAVDDPSRSVADALVRAAVLTPAELTGSLLSAAASATRLSTGPTGRVAGRSVYELLLTPTAAGSLVARVAIDVDARTFTPLRVRIFPAGGGGDPAFTTEFTSIRFQQPQAALFSFTPPTGATVRTQAPGPAESVGGTGWTSVLRTRVGGLADPTSAPSQLETLLASATRVQGAFGAGRLLATSLVTVLVLDDGRVFAGAVTPAVLERRASA